VRSGSGGSPPWWIVAIIILFILLFLMGNMLAIVLPLLFGGVGVWLIYSSIRDLARPARVEYWRGQRIELNDVPRRDRLARTAAAVVLGLALIVGAGWYLLGRPF